MTEKEYWISQFNTNFECLKGRRVALYGTGINAGEILKRFPEYNFLCLVDEKKIGKYIENKLVVSFEEMLELEVDCLIIAARTVSSERVYDRIKERCRAHGIEVYNLYGKDMYVLHRELMNIKICYPQLKKESLYESIDTHEVIAFDVDNTLFAVKKVYKFDFLQKVEHLLLKTDVAIPFFADKFLKIKDVHPDWAFSFIVEQVIGAEGIQYEKLDIVWENVLKAMEEDFIPRKEVLKALIYSLKKGKTVCLVEDMAEYRIQGGLWLKLLEKYGAVGINAIFCSSEYFEDKYQGLIREINNKYPRKKCLYVGDELEADILVPMLYDIDTFWVQSPAALYANLENVEIEMLQNGTVRHSYEDYLMNVYCDSFLMEDVEKVREGAREDYKQLQRQIEFCRHYQGGVYETTQIYTPEVIDVFEAKDDIEEYKRITFEKRKNPIVSIIIPVYNQFAYTYNCLESIYRNTGEVSYEIILADDCSTDQTKELEKIVSGIKVIHNQSNMKFLNNCNFAAKYARGEYILFLNNDTQVQSDWLRPLIQLMEMKKDAGMVGSKLVYPFGCLQEAGGIVWKDASAWNFGHMQNPLDPEYSYVKEADYISGASIMIRKSLWEEIGGFDTRYAPSYYEDTDLAFEVRKHGYKVYYQPASIVVHFEGISNGTDENIGLKSYQKTNREKFFLKWQNTLKNQFENGENVYLAKDRGKEKKQILVIDHYVPNYDKDAGGRCTYMYLKTFLKLGMKVTFVGENFAKPEPYTTELNQMGIEVLYGDFYCMHWKEWMKENLKYFDYIYLQRPHIAVKFIDIIKKYAHGKIFYFAHDLHYLRTYRNYLVTGDANALKESEYWKPIEMELFTKADVGHVVGSYEQKVMQEALPRKVIRNIPLYIYEKIPENIEKDFSKRRDIMFVGGFSHTPNIDAVLWFARDIFPHVLEKYPEMKWHIVGSKAPESILEIADENIIIEGFLSDAELEKLYRKSRLVVVPLRYGAGVKGKVVEAAYYEIPVVTTSIGGEGIDETVGSFIMEDDPDRMAEHICSLYENYAELRQMSDAGRELIRRYYTLNAAERILLEDMD